MSTEAIISYVCAQLAVIIALSSLFGVVARRLGQPTVVGQLLAGVALGPSLLGRLPGDLTDTLFPRPTLPHLNVIAQVALVLFLFSVGYEIDLRLLRQRGRSVSAVSAGGVIVPMALGAGMAFAIHRWFGSVAGNRPFDAAFVGFVAVALAITAVPVLAAIIRERRLAGTAPGVVAMASAGVVDVVGWTALLFVMVGDASTQHRPLIVTLLLLALFLLVVSTVVRLGLRWWVGRWPSAAQRNLLGVCVALAAGSAWTTSTLGLHVIFGAVVAGLVVPRQKGSLDGADLLRPVRDAGEILLPVFFIVAGLSVNIGALGGSDVLLLALLCLAAMAGKLGGCTVAARATGMSWRESAVVGVLLDTRGLTELIVLNVGLQAGLLSPRLYTIFVLMALITTILTSPLLAFLRLRTGSPEPPGQVQLVGVESAPNGRVAELGPSYVRTSPGP